MSDKTYGDDSRKGVDVVGGPTLSSINDRLDTKPKNEKPFEH